MTSKKQIVILAIVLFLLLAGASFINKQFKWFDKLRFGRVEVPSGPYIEGVVISASKGAVLARRIAVSGAEAQKMEILTDKKTVFAKITSSGPIKVSRFELSEGDVIWVYQRLRTLKETIAKPADPDIAIPLEEMLKDPRERIKADFVVKIGGK